MRSSKKAPKKCIIWVIQHLSPRYLTREACGAKTRWFLGTMEIAPGVQHVPPGSSTGMCACSGSLAPSCASTRPITRAAPHWRTLRLSHVLVLQKKTRRTDNKQGTRGERILAMGRQRDSESTMQHLHLAQHHGVQRTLSNASLSSSCLGLGTSWCRVHACFLFSQALCHVLVVPVSRSSPCVT